MTPVETAVSLDQYLNTTYRPDREYIEGDLLERNVGQFDHSRMQFWLSARIAGLEKALGIIGLTEQRVQVSPRRVRIPDVCVLLRSQQRDRILQTPPFLCIEILSPDDRMSEMQDRICDYMNFGVPFVWIIDPWRRKGYITTQDGMTEPHDGILRTAGPEIEIFVKQLFHEAFSD